MQKISIKFNKPQSFSSDSSSVTGGIISTFVFGQTKIPLCTQQ